MKATPAVQVLIKRSHLNKQLFDIVKIEQGRGEFLEVNLSLEQAQAMVEAYNKK